MAAGAPTFSYAQAAKGEVTPVASSTSGNAHIAPEVAEPVAAEKIAQTNGSPETHVPNGEPVLAVEPKQHIAADAAPLVALQAPAKVDTTPSVATELSKIPGSLPERSVMTQSTSTVASSAQTKSDASAATPNESDSTWDKASQVSQPDDKTPSKADSENDDSKLSSWEHVPPAVQLKEAPLPTFNIWHKRAADAKTKGQEQKSANAASPMAAEPAAGSSVKKSANPAGEASARGKPMSIRQPSNDYSYMTNSQELAGPGAQQSASTKPVSAPAPPTDAMLWPTPEGAKEEDKKKTTEKTDKTDKSEGEKTPSKAHGKDKWVQMPYVPTAVFNTPLPTSRRGGRAARGGREGNGRGASNGVANGAEKPFNGSLSASNAQTGAARGEMGPPRQGTGPSKAKRASSAGPSTSIEARMSGDDGGARQPPGSRGLPGDGRRISSGQHGGSRQWSPNTRGPTTEGEFSPRGNIHPQEATHSRTISERRNDGPRSGGDLNGFVGGRERGEGRSERGRGGYRGRGNFSNTPGSHQAGGQAFPAPTSAPPGYTPSKSQSYSDPRRESLPAAGGSGGFQASRDNRHYRNNSRSQSIPTTGYGRFPNGFQHPPPLHTENANMYYSHAPQGVMSAAPFPNYADQISTHWLLQSQMEYYFSEDNLLKDLFLRGHMDSQGFVFLEVLQGFNRVKALTSDPETVRFVCARSGVIEMLTGGDGIDRLRRRGDWQRFILPMQDRNQRAQNEGPTQLHLPQVSIPMPPAPDPRMIPANGPIAPKSASYATHYHPEPLSLGGTPANTTPVTDTPLSAAVPDFTPSMHMAPVPMVQYAAQPNIAAPVSNVSMANPAAAPAKPHVPVHNGAPAASEAQKLPNGSAHTGGTEQSQASADGDQAVKKPINGDVDATT